MNNLKLYRTQNINRIYWCSSLTFVNHRTWSAMNICLQHHLFPIFLSSYFIVTASHLVATASSKCILLNTLIIVLSRLTFIFINSACSHKVQILQPSKFRQNPRLLRLQQNISEINADKGQVTTINKLM